MNLNNTTFKSIGNGCRFNCSKKIIICCALLLCLTFFFLAVATHVGVVAVERSCCGVGTAAVVLSVQRVDSDVNQMEDHFTTIHVSVRVLLCKENPDKPVISF